MDPDVTTPEDRRIIEAAQPHTMTSPARLQAVIDAVRYVVARAVPGDLAECGVWRGGSVLAMLLTLLELGVTDRDVHLYDTFDGMTEPTDADVSLVEGPARAVFERARRTGTRPFAEYFAPEVFDEGRVRDTLLASGYPAGRLHFVRGPVEETLPAAAPERLAVLRLDTDWYESTRHELVHLYPSVEPGGVLIVDDYGHWQGARRAVDEYFAANPPVPLLARVDYTARMAVKP